MEQIRLFERRKGETSAKAVVLGISAITVCISCLYL